MAYLGLELAMLVVQLSKISDYWRRDMFCGHVDFQKTMSREDFMTIRSNVTFRPPVDVPLEIWNNDLLWFGRSLITYFQRSISQVTVPVGTAAHNENTAATKAEIAARSYIPSKPDP